MSEVLSDYAGKVNPEVVRINGLDFKMGEFTMRVRALWMDVAEKYELQKLQRELQTEVIPEISNITADIEGDPRIMSAQRRLDKLNDSHEALMKLYATPEEPEDMDAQLESLVKRMEGVRDEIKEVTSKLQDTLIEKAKWADDRVSELMKIQDEARVFFVWQLANASGRFEGPFEEFYAGCGTDDYEAAERLLLEGNAPWASLYTGRMQEKPTSRKLKN
jgi:hypothetical protein